eukprot:m.232810 g.232810  ORF g.232810 m.232810 type:complete len:109 (-) comp22449_c5_seq3:264-590(-)
MLSDRESGLLALAVRMVLAFVVNFTVGMACALVVFMYNVYSLIVLYQATLLSGLLFFGVAVLGAVSLLGSYCLLLYGSIAGGAYFLVRQAAAVEGRRTHPRYLHAHRE